MVGHAAGVRTGALEAQPQGAWRWSAPAGDALDLYRLKLAAGRFFSASDLADRRRVAVVGQQVWTDLLERTTELQGLEINAGGERLAVVGVLAKKPSMRGGDGPWQWDSRVLVPETTFEVMMPSPHGDRARGMERIFVRLGDAARPGGPHRTGADGGEVDPAAPALRGEELQASRARTTRTATTRSSSA